MVVIFPSGYIWYYFEVFFFRWFIFCFARDWTQGLKYVKHVLYYFNYIAGLYNFCHINVLSLSQLNTVYYFQQYTRYLGALMLLLCQVDDPMQWCALSQHGSGHEEPYLVVFKSMIFLQTFFHLVKCTSQEEVIKKKSTSLNFEVKTKLKWRK